MEVPSEFTEVFTGRIGFRHERRSDTLRRLGSHSRWIVGLGDGRVRRGAVGSTQSQDRRWRGTGLDGRHWQDASGGEGTQALSEEDRVATPGSGTEAPPRGPDGRPFRRGIVLERAVVGFAPADSPAFHLMQRWHAVEFRDFRFERCVDAGSAPSDRDEVAVKRCARSRVDEAGVYIALIGEDTAAAVPEMRWEVAVALEKHCRIIAVNLDGSRRMVPLTCPAYLRSVGAVFVAFTPRIVAHAIRTFRRGQADRDYYFHDHMYERLGL